jgi:hypothetical protein
MDFVTTSCHDTGTILPRRVRDPLATSESARPQLKMRQSWQGSITFFLAEGGEERTFFPDR